MSKTNDVRKLVMAQLTNNAFLTLHGIKSVNYEMSDDETLFPHIVYTLESINLGDLSRDDLMLLIDIYDKSESADLIENIADDIENMFDYQNLPQDKILPTFFLENRRTVKDEDKKIRHKQIEISIQNYER